VAQDAGAEHDGARFVPGPRPIDDADEQRPCDQRREAVRDRVRIEGENQKRVRTANDADPFPPQEQEHRPEHVGELRGEEQGAERCLGGNALGRERDRVVAEEDGPS
jgi:hypothetical protein